MHRKLVQGFGKAEADEDPHDAQDEDEGWREDTHFILGRLLIIVVRT